MRKNTVPTTRSHDTPLPVKSIAAANGYAVLIQLTGRETRSAVASRPWLLATFASLRAVCHEQPHPRHTKRACDGIGEVFNGCEPDGDTRRSRRSVRVEVACNHHIVEDCREDHEDERGDGDRDPV